MSTDCGWRSRRASACRRNRTGRNYLLSCRPPTFGRAIRTEYVLTLPAWNTVQHEIEGVFRLDGDIDRIRIGGAAGGVIPGFRDDHGLARRDFERVRVQHTDPVAKCGIVAGAEIGVGVAIIGVAGLIARVAIVRQAPETFLNDRYTGRFSCANWYSVT